MTQTNKRLLLPKCGVCGVLGSPCDIEQALKILDSHKELQPLHKNRVHALPLPQGSFRF